MKNLFFVFAIVLLASCSKKIVETVEKTPVEETKETSVEKITYTHTFKNQVFTIAPEINQKECKVYGDCDCCTSDLILLNKKDFIYVIHCVNDKSVTKGTYTIKNNQLTLDFDEICVQLEYNWEYETDKTNKEFLIKNVPAKQQTTYFAIEKCSENNLLVFKHADGVEYGLCNYKTTVDKEIEILESYNIMQYLK